MLAPESGVGIAFGDAKRQLIAATMATKIHGLSCVGVKRRITLLEDELKCHLSGKIVNAGTCQYGRGGPRLENRLYSESKNNKNKALNDGENKLKQRLKERLASYRMRELPSGIVMPEAAVLMPFTDENEPELILTVRSSSMPTHAGEVAFPGGKRDDTDKDLLTTALRESHEEVGLPAQAVDVLGQLSPVPSLHGMKVTPFVGMVDPNAQLRAEPREIAKIFKVPLSFFLEEKPQLSQEVEMFGRRFYMPSYDFEGHRIWGLTAFMLIDFLNHTFDVGIAYEVENEPVKKGAAR